MKKIISLFFLFTALFATVGCQSDEPTPQPIPNPNPTPDPILTLTSSGVIDVNSDGGRITITYTLENKQEDIELEVYTSAEWINIAGHDTEGEIYADIAPNSSDARSGEIHIGYGKDSAVITVNQAGDTISTFIAQDVHGYYYGEYYSKGMGNYFINVSDHGFDEYGEALPNSHYYRFDAYAPLYEGDKSGKIPVAEGNYRYDPNNTFAAYTFSAEYSYYWTTDENGDNLPSQQITEGTLTISSEGLTAELLIDGKIHRIEYTGKVELINDEREWVDDVSGPATTLTTDFTPTLDNHYYYKEEYGDYYAWGETETKSEYTEGNSATYGLSISELQSQGYIDGEGNLNPQYDAATANWGGDWRMPTKAELNELLNNCTWTWTTQNGHKGYKVTGPNGNSIFLPAAMKSSPPASPAAARLRKTSAKSFSAWIPPACPPSARRCCTPPPGRSTCARSSSRRSNRAKL